MIFAILTKDEDLKLKISQGESSPPLDLSRLDIILVHGTAYAFSDGGILH